MDYDKVVRTVDYVMVAANVGLGAFAAEAQGAGHALPWWVVATAAALNAIVHLIPQKAS